MELRTYDKPIIIDVVPRSNNAKWIVSVFGKTFFVMAATNKIPSSPTTQFKESIANCFQIGKPGILVSLCDLRKKDLPLKFLGWLSLEEIQWSSHG